MAKKKLEGTKKKLDTTKIFVRIMSLILAILMVAGVSITLIYYLISL